MNKAEFLVILIITVIVLIIWGASSFLHSRTANLPNPDAKQYLDPVEPTFDQDTLNKINSLPVATPSASKLPLFSPSPTPLASPSATPQSRATTSPSPSLSPTPSPSTSSVFP